MKKTLLATALLLAVSGTASASTGEFCMFDGNGAAVSDFSWGTTCDQNVTGTVDGATFEVASPAQFFGQNWTAHSGSILAEGTHTIDTIQGGIYTVTVGAGQVGGHILFNWGAVSDIDVINIWDVTSVGGNDVYTSTDFDNDGILGGAMLDGAFAGFSANFNMTSAVPVPAAVWLFGSGLVGLAGVARRRKAA